MCAALQRTELGSPAVVELTTYYLNGSVPIDDVTNVL